MLLSGTNLYNLDQYQQLNAYTEDIIFNGVVHRMIYAFVHVLARVGFPKSTSVYHNHPTYINHYKYLHINKI